jgi:predicted RNA-binding Zn ribbon-like protein
MSNTRVVTDRSMKSTESEGRLAFEFTGGRTCLDFVNTLTRRRTTRPAEHLLQYADVVRWGRLAGILSARDQVRLTRYADEHPVRATRALERAIAFREVLYEILLAVATDRAPRQQDLSALDRVLQASAQASEIRPSAGGFELIADRQKAALDLVVWTVARSALDLIVSADDRPRVRECAASNCAWLFLDTTRNRSRRWCEMKVCGNRNKVRRFRDRTRRQ